MALQPDVANATMLDGSPAPAQVRAAVGAIRVVLCDDHALLRETLRLLLAAAPAITVVGEAADGAQAIALCAQLRPDVVLMDTAMPGMSGIDATAVITRHWPRTRVLMLSGYGQEERVQAARAAGASGYVVKHAAAAELLAAIRTVHASRPYLSAQLLERASRRGVLPQAPAALSAREQEVLQLLAAGVSQRQIAARLGISRKTVEAHREHLGRKLGLRGQAELIHYAIRRGLIAAEATPAG